MAKRKKRAKAGAKKKVSRIERFDLDEGRIIARHYEVIERLGGGWEGEVYKVRDTATGITRAAKLFFPHRNVHNRTAVRYAKKLHRLRECPIVIHYQHQDTIQVNSQPVTVLISEYIEGDLLSEYLKRMPGKRLSVFQGLHLLYALTLGIENIHRLGEYHGDLHSENVIVVKHGLSYQLKVLDFFHWGRAGRENRNDDICFLIEILYEATGGRKFYRKQPKEVKEIICGLKRSLILKKFKRASDLRVHLENLSWS